MTLLFSGLNSIVFLIEKKCKKSDPYQNETDPQHWFIGSTPRTNIQAGKENVFVYSTESTETKQINA